MEFATDPSPLRKELRHAGWCLEYVAVDAGPGRGHRALIAFHGFARPLEDLLVMAERWPEPARLICVHLPHHGASGPCDPELPADAALEPRVLVEMLQRMAEREGCDPDDMDLIGYSIGGRVALALIVAVPALWGRVLLLAPDGLRKAPLYDLTVHTRLGRWLWHRLDRHAAAANRLLAALHRWGVVPKHLVQFALFHTETAAMRQLVWRGWRAHRLLWPSPPSIARALVAGRGPVDFCFGTKDRVIPPSNARTLRRLLSAEQPGKVRFHTVHAGHTMLRSDVLNAINRLIFPT